MTLKSHVAFTVVGLLLGMTVTATATDSSCGPCLRHTVQGILDDLAGQGWVGILVTTNSRLAGSVVVTLIQTSSPAEDSRLQEGDRIIAIDGEPFRDESAQATMDDYRRLTEALEPGETVRLSVLRSDEELMVEIVAARYSFWAKRDKVGGELIRRTHLGNYVPSRR